jgi:hypothetical protein
MPPMLPFEERFKGMKPRRLSVSTGFGPTDTVYLNAANDPRKN